LIAVDSSVAVAAALPWHEAHSAARKAVPRGETALIAQVAVETYSVLTRLPPPQRVSPPVAWEYLRAMFAFPPLTLAADGYAQLLELVQDRGISGGSVYDALIALTAKQTGAMLLTLDRRAIPVYGQLEVAHRLL
jgi:predicted nucleic acid-binding protein